MYVKDFRYKKTWMPGTVVDKTSPVSTRVQLDNGQSSDDTKKTMNEYAKGKRLQIQLPVRYRGHLLVFVCVVRTAYCSLDLGASLKGRIVMT